MENKGPEYREVNGLFATEEFCRWNRRLLLVVDLCCAVLAAVALIWARPDDKTVPLLPASLMCALTIAFMMATSLVMSQRKRFFLFVDDSKLIMKRPCHLEGITFGPDAPIRITVSNKGRSWRLESTDGSRLKARLLVRAYPTLLDFLGEMQVPFELAARPPANTID